MTVLVAGVGLLVVSFLVQLLIWRVALPPRQTRALLILFTVAPIAVAALAWAAQRPLVSSPLELVRLALFYISCTLAYIVLYSAIEAQSPTLAIVSHLAAAGSAGSTDDDMYAHFGSDDTMRNRISAIEEGGWIARDGEAIILTPAGLFYARLFDRGSIIVGLGLTKGG
jgi:hypothetical protein